MILSAGYGTRLWPLTEDRTKPALPILGKPLVGYVAEYLANFGCEEIVVNLHHRPESVRAALGDGRQFGVSLTYTDEPIILGTSGALDNARHLLDRDTFIVINGKLITDIDLNQALQTHRKSGALATLILLPNNRRERFSVVELENGFVKGFGGMPPALVGESRQRQEDRNPGQLHEKLPLNRAVELDHDDQAPYMFTGIQILEPRIFDYIPRSVFSHSTTDVYPQAIAQGERIAAHVGTGSWHELSTIQRYLDVSLGLLAEQGASVHTGLRSNIAAAARIDQAVIWDDVSIEAGATVTRAVIADGVRLRSGDMIENAVVVRADLVRNSKPPAKALKGEFRGNNFVVPLAQ
jgi:NDP-sugar pyrophosphorylase family protein